VVNGFGQEFTRRQFVGKADQTGGFSIEPSMVEA
jgi:hypothetical protein